MKLLLINPNASHSITERLAESARAALEPSDTLTALTAPDGPLVVRDASQLAQAELSALRLADAHAATHDAVLLAISLDGAAAALRRRHPQLPIVGMTEAALFSARTTTERIGLLTLGAALLPLYRERVEQAGFGSNVIAFEAPELPAAFAADALRVSPDVLDVLARACGRLRNSGAEAVVLAGAVLCGYADRLTDACGLPVLDGVMCGVQRCRTLFAERQPWRSQRPK